MTGSDDFAERLDDSIAEQWAAEKECRIKGHVIVALDRYCVNCGRYVPKDPS